ncbi:MAG TPA: hypothetical protein VEH57_08915 [Thermoplasmata archaeon]|nr:hypothetical protein [Thermoplasmata archaeon]
MPKCSLSRERGFQPLSTFSDAAYRVLATISLGPHGRYVVAFLPVTDTLFVTNYGTNTVNMISAIRDNVINHFGVEAEPAGIA